MDFELQRKSIKIEPRNDQDKAFLHDTLLIPEGKTKGDFLAEKVAVNVRVDSFGNLMYLEIHAK